MLEILEPLVIVDWTMWDMVLTLWYHHASQNCCNFPISNLKVDPGWRRVNRTTQEPLVLTHWGASRLSSIHNLRLAKGALWFLRCG